MTASLKWLMALIVWIMVVLVTRSWWTVSVEPADPNVWHWVRSIALGVFCVGVAVWIERRRRTAELAELDQLRR